MVFLKEGSSIHKAGKLLRVRVAFSERIEHVRITGDFFLHPEESIKGLEELVVGARAERDEVRARVDAFLRREGVQAFGFDADSLTEAIMKAVESGNAGGVGGGSGREGGAGR